MNLASLEAELAPLRARLLAHPMYAAIAGPGHLRTFMEHHVFAVWDFMSLLKALQARLTCVTTPWLPTRDPVARRMLNEIVLVEESDDDGSGGYASHFEIYLAAMHDVGADVSAARRVIEQLSSGAALPTALDRAEVPTAARAFVTQTFGAVDGGTPAELAAAFTYGREDVIPDMFRRLVAAGEPGAYPRLRHYLERHIEVDDGEHGPAARRLVAQLCGSDPVAWNAAARAATLAIEARLALWDAVLGLL